MITTKETPDSEQKLRALLHPLIQEWFFTAFPSFSLPQLFAVSEIHSRNNILVSAPTGATKTLTGFLSVLNELVDSAQKGILQDKVYCVYVSPLKALNNDIERNLKEPLEQIEKIAGRDLGIRIAVRTGDTTPSEKSRMLKKPPHILITTPESLAIVLSSSKFIDHLRGVQWCIVDEVHALAENKRGVHFSLSLERLQVLSSHICRVGLSATIAPIEDIARYLVGNNAGTERDCLIANVQFVKKMDLKVLSPVPDLINVSPDELSHELYTKLDELISQHRTTLIFTNTRAATERVVNHLKEKFPDRYETLETTIGAHHGSMSKEARHTIEKKLKRGELKAVVSSTSLELGIDIGYIDLVILLGSPKSVARAIQRIGRAGHQLGEISVGRLMVLDRDDLVECAVLLKSALERRIDRIHIPTNCLDVLAQQIFGMAIVEQLGVHDLFMLVRNSYCYQDLEWKDFMDIIDYLSGKYISLEDRHVYAKIWHDEQTQMIGRKGRMSRVIYMTNIGTIPDESHVLVKIGEQTIGHIDEAFLERLKGGDVFVLGGDKYEFKYSRGTTAQVSAASYKQPTIPSWFSEMLPLSFDLAMSIGRFRRLMEEKFTNERTQAEIVQFITGHLSVDENAALAIFHYFDEQFRFAQIPHDRKILIEYYREGDRTFAVFHAMFGRRVNDCLARAIAFAISRSQHRDVEIGITDNGFFLGYEKPVNITAAIALLNSEKFRLILDNAIERTEVLKRRFRHCATRSLMILRQYGGQRKNVGRQQVSSIILMSAVRRISPNFPILKEARREVLEDVMDVQGAQQVLKWIEDGHVRIKETRSELPSPFAFKLVLEAHTDFLRMEDKMEFLRRMHREVLRRIGK